VLCEHLLEEQQAELKREFEVFQKKQQKAEKITVYKKFDELMMNA